MGILTDTLRQVGRQSAVPSEAGAGVGQISEREQAIIDRHKEKNANRGSLFQEIAQARAEREIATRRQQRAYAEQPPSTIAQITVDPVREMISSLGDRAKVLDIYRKLSPEQRQEALNLAPGIAQQLGDDRGNIVERAASAVGRGISNTSQPIAELFGAGGTPEEIDFVRQLEAAASSEISPARPGDPWYERGAMGAAEMAPWMATTIGGGVAGGAAARAGGQLLARGASAGVPGAKTVFQGIGAAGRLPRAVGLAGATTKGTMEGVGTVAGIAAAGFPGQYAQEVDQLKELGMEDNIKMRLLAGTTAAVASALEGIVPNPIGGGKVPLTDGAVKAARQYLWEAAKKAPSEMSEEYLQGVTSGLGQHVAQYIDKNAEDKSIADAFQMGYEQTIEAALPMAFLLGVPAVGGAGMAANRARLSRLQEIRSKGFVSTEDAQKEGIEGKNRKERLANADKDIKELEQVLAEGATKPPATGQAQPPLAKGAEDASQVQQNEGSTQVQGDVGQGSQIPGSGEVRVEGQEQGGKEQSSKEPAAQEVPVDTAGDKKKPRVYREMAADELDSIINPNTSSGETFGGAKRFWSDNPDLAIGQGKNKGFVVELDPSGFKFQEHYKPGTAVPGVGKEFTTRHRAGEFRPGVRSITIKPGAVGSSAVRVKKFLESETNAGRWSKSEVEGGGAVYSPVDAAKLTDESGEQLGNKPGAKPRAKPEQSKAIVAYHGRRAVFPVSEFRIGGETSLLGRGIWFTDDEKAATTYSSIDPSVNVDVPGQIEALAEQLGVSYREAKEIFADGAESNVVKVALDIKRPMDLSPNTPIKVSEQQFKLAAAEADVTLPDNAYSRFVEKGNAKEQIEYLQRIKASQMVSRIASIQNHDAIIFRDGIAPRSKGTEYLILDKSAIQETASPEKPSQPTTTAEEPAAVPEPAVDFNRLVETNSPVNPQASLELDGIRYDQKKGIGSTGNNGNINYMGFVVVMTPDEFLGLNTVRNTEGDAGVDWIENAIREGEAIGSPSISVEVMEDGTFQVSGHEGRGRAHAIKKINPKARLLVHVFPRHKRARDFTPETIFKTIAPDPSRVSYGASRGSDVSPKQAVLNKKAYTSGEQVGNKTAEKAPTTQQPEDTATSEQDEFDAGMEELMAGLAKPESGLAKPQVTTGKKRPAGKPRSVKKQPAKTPQEKSDDDRARAAAKREEAKRKMREAFGDTQSKALSVFDPEVGMKVAQAAKLYIEAGALDFRAFIRDLAEDFGKPWVEDKAKYLESAWRTANKLEWVDSPTGKVSDILPTLASDYGTLESPNRVELGKHFQQQLESGKDYKSIVEARKEAATLIAGENANIEPGTPAAKAIDEAVEQGIVRAAREVVKSNSDPMKVYDDLLDLYERQPRLNVRTGTSMRQQAYSTPAPAAWIASILSDTSRGDTAYDSSAGNGMLLLGVDPENAIANELNPDRAQALRELGYQVNEGDATKYTPEQKPDRIIINPPFGELEGQTWKVGGITTDKIDHAIVLNTLESLPEDGKAVLIIGSKGFEQRKPKDELRRGEAYKNDKNFYNALYDGYNVTDHFTLHGDLYSKQGAAFPIDVIVIDGRGKSELPKPYQIDRNNAIPRVINNWQELRDVGERYLDTGTGRPGDLSTEQVEGDLGQFSGLLEGQNQGDGSQGGKSNGDTGVSGGVSPRGNTKPQKPRGDSGQSSVSGAPDKQGSGESERLSSKDQSGSTARSNQRDDAGPVDRGTDVADDENSFQEPYEQRSGSRNVGTLVPTTHVRAVQNALDKAEDRYGNLDEFVASELGYSASELEEYFSAEQVDALALTIARHKEGKAFVLGDQTGVGKGRVAAATMVYAKRQGLVPVFVTQSSDLYSDMYRDLQDIGQHSEGEPFYALATNTLAGKDKIELPDGTTITQNAKFAKDTFNEVATSVVQGAGPVAIIKVEKTTDAKGNPLGKTPKGKQRVRQVQEKREYDAVFTAYSQMQTVAGQIKDRHTAMQRIAPNAFFILDESHNAGGVTESNSRSGDDEGPTGRAARIRSLVSEAKGVLFLSATFAKNPGVMDLYAKTGMDDAVQGSDEALIETIIKGGLPLQQVLSEMLVESGTYMRREKSFKGIGFNARVEETGETEAGEVAGIFDAINVLDTVKNDITKTKAFRRWLTSQGLGLGNDSATGNRGMDSYTFSSIVHNLVDQMLLSIKADAVANEAIASLERGESPTIALSNTAGSALRNYLENFPAEVGEDIDFGFNTTAMRYLERSRQIMLTETDAAGKRTSRQVRLPDEVLGEDGLRAYNNAKQLIEGFAADIPASPIDHIRNRIEQAGYKVAEITGRDMMVDYSGEQMRLARRPSEEQGKAGKLASVRKYNAGEIDVLILNQSGSTGLSAHASDKFKNQKRRHMIIAQADKNIDTFMQMLGRINRTGQVEQHKGQAKGSNLPHYTLLMTNVPAEIRPSSVLIKKLSSLNANVTADSKGSVSFDAPDILNKVGDRVVAEYIADNPALNHALGDIVEVNADGAPRVTPDIARKVSGRMAMRPIPEQKAFWDSVTETYAEEIEQLNKLGKNPLAATRMDLGARTLERVEIFAGDKTADSPFLQPAYADRVRVKKQGEPMTPDEIKSSIEEFYGAKPNIQMIQEWSARQGEIASDAIDANVEQQVARMVSPEAIARVRGKGRDNKAVIQRRLNSLAPGMVVGVSEVVEGGGFANSFDGIVIDAKAKKGKEHLPSGWIVTIALSSPDRVLRVPFTRIDSPGNSQPGDVFVAAAYQVASDRLYARWEETGDVYEERIIGTGNVLAAFDQLVSDENRGNIVFFTDQDGASQRGVLMPRNFSLDRWAEKRPATFATPQQVLDFISIDPGHQVNDPNFAIQFTLDGDTMNVRSPRSRQRSGKYTTNKELIEASGTDFVSVGQILQMKVRGKKQQLAVIEAAQAIGPLIAANYKEDAKRITDAQQPPTSGSGGGTSGGRRDSGESRALDAFMSPDLQDRQSMGAARRKIASASDLVGDDAGAADGRYASPDSDFEQRWQRAARGIGKKTLASKLREFWQELVKSTVRGSLPELPRTEQFGEARSAMHAYQNAPFYAQVAAVDLLKKTSKPLSASDYDLFTRIVIMRDQVEAASKGERLSYGLTPEKARAELARVESLANDNERVQASLEYRKQWTEAMVDDFLSAHEYLGLDMSNRFKRENYFRHQVLYYAEAKQRGLGKKKVELSPNRSWLKGRTSGEDLGEAFDINANYLQAEWEVSTQMIADTKRAQAIGRLKRHYDKMRQLKATAKQNNYVAVVGGQKNMDEIEKLRGMMAELRATGSLDSGEKAQLKEWSERLWELDPTMSFRQDMAIARDQIERGSDALGERIPADFMRYVASLAKRDDSPLQGPAKAFLKAVSDRKKFIKGILGDKYETWEDVVPDDHEEVAIRPGRAMFQAYSVPEQIASELMADLSKTLGISAEDLRPLTALGSKYTPLVVPEEVAAQMAAIDNTMDFGWLDHMVTRPMNAWKRLVLMGPTRFLKYNLRNLSEIDKVMSLNPAALKEIPRAIRDLWKLYRGANDIPASVRDWAERGGTSTLVRVNELGELNELKEFARLIADKKSGVVGKIIKAPANLWRTYWSAVGIGSDFRESILRYAAYLSYMKQLEAGKLTNYGGSVRSEVDGIKDNKDKAMRLSADLLGDYGDISQVGQFLRSRVAPFWSFQETNVRTYFRGLMNLASNEQTAIKAGMAVARAAGIGGLAKTPFLAYKLGRIAILFYGFKAMTTAFNQLLFPDDDDELPEEEKRKAHLTFGKNSKGEVQYFTRIGTAADVLDWVGLDSVDYDLRDVLDGRRTIRDVLNDMVRSPVDKAYGMLSPFMKVPTELAVGQSSYPHVGKPRPIRDRGRYIAQNLGLQKEYDKFVGNPSTPYSFTDLVLYKVEPGTAAYYMTLDAKFRWLKTARNRGVGYSDSNRGNALRSYKMAMRLNDQVAVDKYLAEYEAAEGTKEGLLDSMEWSHPAGGLSTIDAYLFYKSLAPVEQDEYREAERFYYSELLSEEQAKQIRARRDSRLRKLAFGRNKDGSPKGRPSRQSDETHAKYRERLNEWVEERKIAQEAVQEYRKLDGETEP